MNELALAQLDSLRDEKDKTYTLILAGKNTLKDY